MSNGDVVRSIILAQNSGDDEGVRAGLHPEVVWHTAPVSGETAPPLKGADAILQVVRETRAQEGALRITMHEVLEAGDDVLVVGSVAAERGLRMPRAWIWRMEDGRAVQVESYTGRNTAMRAWNARHGQGSA